MSKPTLTVQNSFAIQKSTENHRNRVRTQNPDLGFGASSHCSRLFQTILGCFRIDLSALDRCERNCESAFALTSPKTAGTVEFDSFFAQAESC